MTCKHEGCNNETDGKRSACRPCRYHVRKYGITTPQRDAMLEEQNNECLICGSYIEFTGAGGVSKHKAVIDHCHAHGNVRGILCSACNVGLGAFYDNQDNLTNAINYLKEGSYAIQK